MDTGSIFRDLRTPLERLLRKRGRTREDAEDLIHDAFVRLQVYYRRGGEVRQPEAFLVKTVLRLSMNAHRDAHTDLYVDESSDTLRLLDTTPAPDEIFAAEQCLRQMKHTLDQVSQRTREVFFLNRVDGLTYAQIAKLYGMTPKAVERRLARAMLALSNEGHSP